MDFLRASIGNATLWEPKKSFIRIIFMLVILPFIIITSLLQSELTSIISETTKELKVEKIEDLIKEKYEVFIFRDLRDYYLTSPF